MKQVVRYKINNETVPYPASGLSLRVEVIVGKDSL